MRLNTDDHNARSDHDVLEDVIHALQAAPCDAGSIAVSVSHGIVTLYGCVQSREVKWLAEDVVKETAGVRGVANDLEVCESLACAQTDSTIAEAAANAVSWYRAAAPGAVKVIVSDGWITLTGVVADIQERGAAERAVRRLTGVRGVSNALTVVRTPQLAERRGI
jgi:osmotically-inducible protein OsmY